MTTDPPPDRPTERLRPTQPIVREGVVATHDPLLLERLEDSLRSLRTAVALAGLLGALALGVAIYALTQADDEGDGRGASRERVARLDDRVDRLSRQVRRTRASAGGAVQRSELDALRRRLDSRATTGDVAALRSSLKALQDGGSGGDTAALQQRVDRLAQQVADLRAQAPASP
jgi:polyhydroxyalkanoate synthesis regulator phasin